MLLADFAKPRFELMDADFRLKCLRTQLVELAGALGRRAA